MTKNILKVALISTFTASLGWAQSHQSEELDLGLDPVYTETLDVEAKTSAPSQNSNRPIQQEEGLRVSNTKKSNTQTQPIYILNQSNPTATNQAQMQTQTAQVQKQPVTIIESTPVTDSRAEKLRKARQDSEIQTEQKIVEKLESSRLDDEKKRADALFGDRFNQMNSQNQQQVEAPQQFQQPQPVLKPVQVVPVAPAFVDPEPTPEELRVSRKHKELNDTSDEDSHTYFIGLLGVSEFNKASNVQGVMATGFGLGVEYKEHLLAEVDFIYTQFQRNYPIVTNIDQYTFMGQIKYQILRGLIRPIVGGALSYSYRTFDDINPYYYNNNYNNNYKTTSNTLDSGLTAGIDVAPTENFSIGIDYRYMWNLTHKSNGFYPVFFSDQTAIDSLNYYVISLNGRFTF